MMKLSRERLHMWFWGAALAVTFVLSAMVMWQVSLNVLDGDTCTDMVLAQRLNETGRFLSEDWYYSTEIQAFQVQLVFAPLFSVFSSWRMVRFVGSMLLQALMVAGYGFFVYEAKLGKKVFLIGGTLLLLPVSVTYGRVVLYHVFYSMTLMCMFVMTGLFLGLCRCVEERRVLKNARFFAMLLGLAALSVLTSLNGHRQLTYTHAPLLLLGVVWLCRARSGEQLRRCLTLLGLIGFSLVFCLVGLKINDGWSEQYRFYNYKGMELSLSELGKLPWLFFSILHCFGLRRGVPLLSAKGLAAVAGIPVFAYLMLRSVRTFFRSKEGPMGKRLTEDMLAASTALGVLTMCLAFSITPRYALLFVIWFIPLLAQQIAEYDELPAAQKPGMTGKRLVVLGLAGICAVNGLINMRSFSTPLSFDQPYEGIEDYPNPSIAMELGWLYDILEEGEYDLGYGDRWYASVIVERMDGRVRTVSIFCPKGEEPVYIDYASFDSYRTMECRKPFVVASQYEKKWMEPLAEKGILKFVCEKNYYSLYDVVDLAAWREILEP